MEESDVDHIRMIENGLVTRESFDEMRDGLSSMLKAAEAKLEAARFAHSELEMCIIDADIRFHETKLDTCLGAYSSYVANSIIAHQQKKIEQAEKNP